MNRSLLSLALLAATLGATSLAAHAQAVATPPPAAATGTMPHQPHHKMGRLARALRDLDLTPDQRAKTKAAMRSYRASRSSATPETRAQLRSEIEAILTPDQRTRFEASMQRHRPTPVASPAV